MTWNVRFPHYPCVVFALYGSSVLDFASYLTIRLTQNGCYEYSDDVA